MTRAAIIRIDTEELIKLLGLEGQAYVMGVNTSPEYHSVDITVQVPEHAHLSGLPAIHPGQMLKVIYFRDGELQLEDVSS